MINEVVYIEETRERYSVFNDEFWKITIRIYSDKERKHLIEKTERHELIPINEAFFRYITDFPRAIVKEGE